jgi:hypothetical protein
LAFDWLSEWLRPPPDAADDPARARALRWILLGFAATALLTTGVVLLSPGWHRAAPVSLAVLGFWAAAYAMIRRNRLRSATWILVWGLFITVVSGAALGGGLTSPSLPTLSVVILAAGLLLGGRAAVAVSAVCTLTVGGFYAVEEAGLMPAALFVHQNVSTALVHVSGLVGSFLVIASAGVWIQRTSARSTRYEEGSKPGTGSSPSPSRRSARPRRNGSNSRSSCARPRRWTRWAAWRVESLTISTTC